MAEKTIYSGEIPETISAAGHRVIEKIDETRDAAADALHDASDSLRRKVRDLPGRKEARDMMKAAADRVDAAAGYLAEHDTREMFAEARSWVRHNPGAALLTAAALGFFTGRILGRRS